MTLKWSMNSVSCSKTLPLYIHHKQFPHIRLQVQDKECLLRHHCILHKAPVYILPQEHFSILLHIQHPEPRDMSQMAPFWAQL